MGGSGRRQDEGSDHGGAEYTGSAETSDDSASLIHVCPDRKSAFAKSYPEPTVPAM
jgi:hypothetical protein